MYFQPLEEENRKYDKKTVFKMFQDGEMGWRDAVYQSGHVHYPTFLEDLLASGYHRPQPSEENVKEATGVIMMILNNPKATKKETKSPSFKI